MAAAGCPDAYIARALGIAMSTFHLWRASYVEFSDALKQGKEVIDEALQRTAIQRALGYSYETEKAFQTGVVVTITETLPPNEKMLEFLLRSRDPDQYGDKAKHELSISEGLKKLLEEKSEQSKLQRAERARLINAKAVEYKPG
jgi:hypothetical protein